MKILKNISKIIFLSAFSIIYTASLAQKDTTEINLGTKKIIIVDKITETDRKITNLEKGITVFEKQIEDANKELETTKTEIEISKKAKNATSNTQVKDSIDLVIKQKESKIIENEKKIEAFKKGIEGIEKGIKELETEKEKLKEESDIAIDAPSDRKYKKSKKKKYRGHWAGFEMGFASFSSTDNFIANDTETDFLKINPEKTLSYAINFMEFNFPINKNYIGLTTGMGINWSSYSLNKNVDLFVEDDHLQYTLIDKAVREYKSNKLTATYLTIPLILEFQIPAGKHKFFIGTGVTGSLKIRSRQKQKYYIGDDKVKIKYHNDFELSPFQFGATIRVGYESFGIFANYSLTPLVEKGHGPELYPFTIGLRLLNF